MHKVHEILFSPINDFDREAFILNYSFLNSTDRKYLKSKILSDKLSPIFLEYLTKNNLLGFIDKKELDQIASQAQRFQIQNLQIVREVVHLSRLFRKENLNPIFLKGVAIIKEYKDLSLRPMVDIDILFKKDEIFVAYDILRKNNFRELRFKSLSKKELIQFSRNVHHLPELVGNSNITIELHHRITKHHDFEECPIAKGIISDLTKIDFFGEKINIPSIEWVITHQLIHFSINSKYNNQLRTFYDLKQIEKNHNIDWKKIFLINENKKIKHAIASSIAVMNENFIISKSFREIKDTFNEYFPIKEDIDFLFNKSIKIHEKNLSSYLFDKVDTFTNLSKTRNIFELLYQIFDWTLFRVNIFFKLKK